MRLRPGICGARCGGGAQEQAPRAAPKAAGRLGKHQPTQPEAETTALNTAFDFCLSTSIPVLTTSTYVVAWPQGDQFLGGDL